MCIVGSGLKVPESLALDGPYAGGFAFGFAFTFIGATLVVAGAVVGAALVGVTKLKGPTFALRTVVVL